MKNKVLILTFLLLSARVSAQTLDGTVTVGARQDILSVLPENVSYFLPEFEESTVFFNDGTSSTGKVNICLVDNSVRFIQESGDTLLLSSYERVLRIQVADTVLAKANDCFVKQILIFGNKSLGERRRLELETDQEKQGGYGSLPPTSTAKAGNMMRLDPTREFDVTTKMSYSFRKDFVLTDGEKVYPAGTSAFVRLFPDRKKEIRSFVKENRTDFDDKLSLVQLFLFCAGQ